MRRISMVLMAALALAIVRPPLAHSAMAGSQGSMAGTQPIILGEVMSNSSHLLTVRAVDGEVMPIEFDSRTVMKNDLTAGTLVRVEFKLLDNGVHLAQRVTPLEKGSHDWDAYAALIGADNSGLDAQPAMAGVSAGGNGTETHTSSTSSTSSGGESESTPETRTESTDTPQQAEPTGNGHDTNASHGDVATANHSGGSDMPDTASAMPSILIVGLLLLVGAASLWWNRRNSA